jgi:hypothetical protein
MVASAMNGSASTSAQGSPARRRAGEQQVGARELRRPPSDEKRKGDHGGETRHEPCLRRWAPGLALRVVHDPPHRSSRSRPRGCGNLASQRVEAGQRLQLGRESRYGKA